MIYFLTGQAQFSVHQRRRELLSQLIEKYPNAILDTFDIEENPEFSLLRESLLSGGGLFSSGKWIDIRTPFLLSETQQENLVELLKNRVALEDEFVVLSQGEVKQKKSKLFLFLKKNSKNEDFPPLQGLALKKWVTDQFQERSNGLVSIDPATVEKLVALTNGDGWKTSQEIDKLVNYISNGRVKIEDVDALSTGNVQTKIFDLVDAISNRDRARANELIFRLVSAGENEFYLFTMLVSQFRNMLKVYDCQKKGIFSQAAVSQSLGIHPFVAGKTINQMRLFSLAKLKEIFQLAADLDYQAKTGQREMESALTYFIARV